MQRIENRPGCFYNLVSIESLPVTSIDTSTLKNDADFKALGPEAKWGKTSDFPTPPAIGTRVNVRINALGAGAVAGYFVEHGWLGVYVVPDARPEWHVKQNPNKNYYLVFGVEIEAEKTPALPSSAVLDDQVEYVVLLYPPKGKPRVVEMKKIPSAIGVGKLSRFAKRKDAEAALEKFLNDNPEYRTWEDGSLH